MSRRMTPGPGTKGPNGYCTQIGNELFASFESTESKSRLNFLEILRRPHTDYVINEFAVGYWKEQELAVAVIEKLCQGPHQFGDAKAWQVHMQELGITAERHIRIASEGALLGSLINHGVSAELGILSDGAGQFDVLVHAACWIHAERPLTRMVPYSDEHRAAIEKVRQRIWEFYQDLKAYRLEPEAARRLLLEARFDAICADRTGFPSVDVVLKGMSQKLLICYGCWSGPSFPCTTTSAKATCGTTSRSGRSAVVRGTSQDVAHGHLCEFDRFSTVVRPFST